MKVKQMYMNLLAQMMTFTISFAISFFVSPMIVRSVGKEVYGFLGIANSFTSYVTIVTVALNSLAGRFVSIYYCQNKFEETSEYYSSVFYANMMIVLILFVPAMIFSLNADKFLDVPVESVVSVKMTFCIVFLGFFVNLASSIFSVATFVTNKIYLSSIRTIEANLLRLIILIITFTLFTPSIEYVALAMLGYYLFVAITNYRYTKILIPEIRIKRSLFNIRKVRELIISGCWSSITALSNVLLEGLDLLISNLLLGVGAMGTVSIVKTVPNMIYQCMGYVMSGFTPQLTISYANGNILEMISYLNYACKVVALLMALPVAFLIAFGQQFFALWMPTEDATILWILSILSMGELLFAGSISIMHNIFTVTNRLKILALATLTTGVLNTVIVFSFLKMTSLGIFAVVSVSSILAIVRNLLINIPYSAKCVGVNPLRFYKIAGRSFLFVVISSAVGSVIAHIVNPGNWGLLIICAGIMCIVAITIEFMLFFSKEEKEMLITMIKKTLGTLSKAK